MMLHTKIDHDEKMFVMVYSILGQIQSNQPLSPDRQSSYGIKIYLGGGTKIGCGGGMKQVVTTPFRSEEHTSELQSR